MSTSPLRPEIQGLRALAVLLVVLFHAELPGLNAGYVGVDLFFVISGYLITQLLIADQREHGRIRFAEFYARRARRLLPAALLLLLVTIVVTRWLYPPAEQREALMATRAAAVYLSNFWFASIVLDYFASGSQGNALLHTWSLSLEEQFYLVWPLLLALLLRCRDRQGEPRRMLQAVLLAGVCALSLAACLLQSGQIQPWSFYGMPFRAWEFGLGALVALRPRELPAPRSASWLGWLGLLMLLGSAMLIPPTAVFPGAWALLPAGGAALLLLGLHARGPSCLLTRGFSVPPLVRLGDLSYSWYLWHWPLLVWTKTWLPQPAAWQTALVLLVSLLVAWLSLHLVENPVRRARGRWAAPWPSIILALLSSAAVAGLAQGAMNWRQPANAASVAAIEAAAQDQPRLYQLSCHQFFFDSRPGPCFFGSADPSYTVVLIGDSHAAQWFPALENVALQRGWRLVTMTKAACPALDLVLHAQSLRRRYTECEAWRQGVLEQVQLLRPRLLILSTSNHYLIDEAERAAGLRRWLQALAPHVATLAVLRDTPRPGFNPVQCVARARWRGDAEAAACQFDGQAESVWRGRLAAGERAVVTEFANARYLDLSAAICNRPRCAVRQGEQMLFADDHHLTARYAAQLAAALDAQIAAEQE